MRSRDTRSRGAWRDSAGWLQRRENAGGPALLYVTSAATGFVVLAITLLAVVEQLWMVGLAFIALVISIAALTGFIAVMLTDTDGR
jgi:hypothetical protein